MTRMLEKRGVACGLVALVGAAALGCSVEAVDPTQAPAPSGRPPGSDESGITTLASEQARPTTLTVSGDFVYWTNYGDGSYATGSVMRAPTRGGAAEALATAQDFPQTLAVDGVGVTWATYGSIGAGSLLRTSLDGGAMFALASGIDLAAGIAVAEGRAYWTEMLGGKVGSVLLDGGGEETLASNQEGAGPIAIASGSVFWGVGSELVHTDGGGGVKSAWTGAPPAAIVAVGDGVVWITRSGDVMRAKAGGEDVALLAPGGDREDLGGVPGIAADAEHVYFTNPAEGLVLRVALAGGEIDVVAADQGLPGAIAVDEESVYWVDAARGLVLKIERP